MLSIIYSSRATSTFDKTALLQLLAQSRKNNEADALTGMLLYRSGYFLQVIEGPDENVHARMAVIHQDPRHSHIRHLVKETTTERLFLGWTMGFEQLGDTSDEVPGARTTFDDLAQNRAPGPTINAVRALLAWYRRPPN